MGTTTVRRAGFVAVLVFLVFAVVGVVIPAEPGQAAPLPAAPAASASPDTTASPNSTASASASPGPTPHPADEGRWVQLAIVVGGGLVGIVVLFLLIGALLRLVARHRRRR